MNSIPAHKQTDPDKLPGQIRQDITLGDYINRKLRNEAFNVVNTAQQQTFDEWFAEYNKLNGLPPAYEVAKAAWYAAKGK